MPDFWLDHPGSLSQTINHNLKYWLNLATDPYVVLREIDNDRIDVKGKRRAEKASPGQATIAKGEGNQEQRGWSKGENCDCLNSRKAYDAEQNAGPGDGQNKAARAKSQINIENASQSHGGAGKRIGSGAHSRGCRQIQRNPFGGGRGWGHRQRLEIDATAGSIRPVADE
jgi:hypothetical protein